MGIGQRGVDGLAVSGCCSEFGSEKLAYVGRRVGCHRTIVGRKELGVNGRKCLGVFRKEIKRLKLGQLGIEPRTPNLKVWRAGVEAPEERSAGGEAKGRERSWTRAGKGNPRGFYSFGKWGAVLRDEAPADLTVDWVSMGECWHLRSEKLARKLASADGGTGPGRSRHETVTQQTTRVHGSRFPSRRSFSNFKSASMAR